MNSHSAIPAGVYRAHQGDCLASIAHRAGFSWRDLWEHPRNATLREKRKDPYVLFPGDEVFIPSRQPRSFTVETGRLHRFVYTFALERFRLCLLNGDGEPRSGLAFSLDVDGDILTGTTKKEGLIEVDIRPTARIGRLTIQGDGGEEVYEVQLGHLDPISEVSGVQARLNNLGFASGPVDGRLGPKTAGAIRAFQTSRGLTATGELDGATRDELRRAFGS